MDAVPRIEVIQCNFLGLQLIYLVQILKLVTQCFFDDK